MKTYLAIAAATAVVVAGCGAVPRGNSADPPEASGKARLYHLHDGRTVECIADWGTKHAAVDCDWAHAR